MRWTPAETALIGTGVGALAATIPAVINWLSNKSRLEHERQIAADTRAHEQTLARAERRYADLRSLYTDTMRWLIGEVERMRRTFPVWGPVPEPPASLDEPTAMELQSRIYAYASEPVKAAIEEFLTLRLNFSIEADHLTEMKAHRDSGGTLSQGESQAGSRQEIQRQRTEAAAVMERIRVLVRDELAS